MLPRAQAGLEYLMTYGWALVLVAAIVAALVYVVGSPASSVVFSSSDAAKMSLKSSGVSASSAEIMLQNLTGGPIEVESVHFFGSLGAGSSLSLNGETVFPVTVPVGSELLFSGLVASQDCSGGGSMLVFYSDRFGFEKDVKINCNGGSEMPVAWYRFEEGNDETTGDSSGEGHDGTLLPADTGPIWIDSGCPSGNCLQFDGVEDYVSSSGFSSLGTSNKPYSFTGWFKAAVGEQNGNIIHMSSGSTGSGWCLPPVSLDSEKIRGMSWVTSYVYSTNNISPDTWYHFANTWDSTNGLRLFVNGALENTTPHSTYSASGQSNYIWFAFTPNGCAGNKGWFNGFIDEVRIFNRSLTAFEVCSLCNEHAANAGVTCTC